MNEDDKVHIRSVFERITKDLDEYLEKMLERIILYEVHILNPKIDQDEMSFFINTFQEVCFKKKYMFVKYLTPLDRVTDKSSWNDDRLEHFYEEFNMNKREMAEILKKYNIKVSFNG